MKINWLVRFKNKTFLLTFIPLILAFVYQLLGLFEVVPRISENDIMNFISIIINLLAALGVITDPTTAGLSDSERALTYTEPK